MMIQRLANPHRFSRLSATLLPWLGWLAAGLIAAGLYLGFFASPPDYQQGETARDQVNINPTSRHSWRPRYCGFAEKVVRVEKAGSKSPLRRSVETSPMSATSSVPTNF